MKTAFVWNYSRRALTAGLFCWSATVPLFAQSDGAILAARGVTVRGTVRGSVIALDEAAKVTIEQGSDMAGELVLPAKRTAGPPEVSKAAIISVTNGATAAKQRVAKGYALPKPDKSKSPHGSQVVILETGREPDPDFGKLRDLTLRNVPQGMELPPRSMALPPGDYGKIVVEQGQLLLGIPGSKERVRYSFEQLTIGARGAIELMGPVVLTVDQLGAMDGRMGNRRFTQWLDLRVTAGDVVLGSSSEVHGVVTAPNSAVTLGRGAKARGGIVCDQATVETDARFTGLQPSWSSEATGNAAPLFVHRATRVTQQLDELSAEWSDSYAASVSFPDDLPSVELKETAAKITTEREQRAFFDACAALFGTSGFDQGALVMGHGRSAINVTISRANFEKTVRVVGRVDVVRSGIPIIRSDPALLAAFKGQLLSTASAPTS